MQSPTPPTKPIPPTPPTLKTSSTATSSDTHTPPTKTNQSNTLVKETPKNSPKEQEKSNSTPESTNKVPPLGSYSSSKETKSETTIPSPIPIEKKPPLASSTIFFLVIALGITMGTAVLYWFKNSKPKKQTINYSTESTDDIVNLIFSQTPAEEAPPITPKPLPKKLLLKPATKPKNKGGFEVRI